MRYLKIITDREANSVEELLQERKTLTVGELIQHLPTFDEDMPVASFAKRNLTYNFGCVWYDCIEEQEG